MNPRSTHAAIRAWAHGGPTPPASAWMDPDEAGFGSLHALAEEEDAEGRPEPERYAQLCKAGAAMGAPVHSADLVAGHTPLHWCAWHGSPGCASALISCGADVAVRNRSGETPLDVAERLLAVNFHARPERILRLRAVRDLLAAAGERRELCDACPPSIPFHASNRL